MGYTTTYHWGGYKAGDVDRLMNHDGRNIEDPAGKRKRANAEIDRSRFGDNRVMVNDGQGGFREAQFIEELREAFDRRLGERAGVKQRDGTIKQRAVRVDSNVAVQFILQLDPEFTGPCVGMSDDKRKEVEQLHGIMLDELKRRIGAENIVYVAHHWDETNPHMHVMAVPMTKDNRVHYRQAMGKDGKGCDWSVHHDDMRRVLFDVGYEADFERVSDGRNHLEVGEFKEARDEAKAIKQDAVELLGTFRVEAEQEAAKIRDSANKYSDGVRAAADKYSDEAHTRADEYESGVLERVDKAVDEAVASALEEWEREEVPKLRLATVEAAKGEASVIRDEAATAANATAANAQALAGLLIRTAVQQRLLQDRQLEAAAKEAAEHQREQVALELKQFVDVFKGMVRKDVLDKHKQTVAYKLGQYVPSDEQRQLMQLMLGD